MKSIQHLPDPVNGLLQQLELAVSGHSLFEQKGAILLAVSGGVDSIVLLHALHRLSPKHGWQLQVAHLNHGLRGRSSDADEKLVRRAADKLKLKISVEKVNVRSFAVKQKLSVEMAARQLRHEFLARVAREERIRTIALAHHADDQVELFFLRLLRGSGMEGLIGMQWAGPSPADPKISLARPLLGFFKEELLQYARAQNLRFREDQTNRSPDMLRNRLRHELLPLLKKHYQPALSQTTLRLMEIVRAESEFIERAMDDLSTGANREFSLLPLAIQRRLLQTELIKLGVEPNFGFIEELRQAEETAVMIRPETVVKRDSSGRLQIHPVSRPGFDAERLSVSFGDSSGRLFFSGVQVDWRIERISDGKRLALKKGENVELFDAQKIGGSIVLRHWQPGDRFQPIGMSQTVKLQDLLVNQKIPRELRHQLLIMTTPAGETVWVEGLRISERFKLDSGGVSQLKWSWHRV